VGKISHLEHEVDRYGYKTLSEKSGERLDLNKLIKRNKDEQKKNKKINLLILSGVSSLVLVVLILLSIE
tara:strand:- start:520 stop:726 length:207 start_codon:yes stop_codon:yes gene_type:complete